MATPPAPRSRSALAERLGAFGALLGLRDGETVVQVALGLALVGSALVLWRDGATFAISDSYSWFRMHIDEDTAGWALFVPGTAALVGPLFRRPPLCAAISLVLGTVAGVVAAGFWAGSPLSIGAVIFTSPIMLLAYWLVWRRLFP